MQSQLPKYVSKLQTLEVDGTPLHDKRVLLLEQKAPKTLNDRLDRIYQARNLYRLGLAEITEGELLKSVSESSLSGQEKLEGVHDSLVDGLAQQFLASSNATKGDRVVIVGTTFTYPVVHRIAELCTEQGILFDIDVTDEKNEADLIRQSTTQAISALAGEALELYERTRTALRVEVTANPNIERDTAKTTEYSNQIGRIRERRKSGEDHYVVTLLPTEEDARLDGIPYPEYMALFFEACDQPWEQIHEAQAVLIERFDEAKTVRITNNDGTDLTMSIDGMTFANSVTLKNIPGSEIFTGPVRDSVNGTMVAKGRFQYESFGVIEDIVLEFTNGRVTSFSAKTGEDALEKIIEADDGKGEGSRFTGELGIGTNPHLRQHLLNLLLVEKIGGSFHLALGGSYTYTQYDGKPVNVNNGNKSESNTHWDITAMLRDNGGQIHIDDELVQNNGIWVIDDPRLAVLNEGWGSVSEDLQPDWWKKKYPKGY